MLQDQRRPRRQHCSEANDRLSTDKTKGDLLKKNFFYFSFLLGCRLGDGKDMSGEFKLWYSIIEEGEFEVVGKEMSM